MNFRKSISGGKREKKDSIRWRGQEVTRIEAFSDAVFAFAITLLIVALEVPETYHELMACMGYFIPFGICFTILFMVWFAQNTFFRRYGLHDTYTLVLNGVLIFFVLFFVYPLKFLFSAVFTSEFGIDNLDQLAVLFYIYSGGFTCIYILFGLLYHHALRSREELDLTALEVFDTRSHMLSYFVIASVGIFSMFLAFLGSGFINFSGFAYILIGPAVSIMYRLRRKQRAALEI